MDTQFYPNTLILPFSYVVTSLSIPASSQATVNLTMASDCSFELLALLGTSTLDSTSPTPNKFAVQIIDQSTGRSMSSSRIPQNCFGSYTYQGIAYEKYPVRFPAQCVMQFDFLNLDTGNANICTVVLKGYKLYAQK